MSERIRSIHQLGFFQETLLVSAARTGNAVGDLLAGFGRADTLRIELDVTAVTGTDPKLDVTLEDSLDGTTWNEIVAFTQATGNTREVKDFTGPFTDNLRERRIIQGTDTPTFTYSLKIHASRGAR